MNHYKIKTSLVKAQLQLCFPIFYLLLLITSSLPISFLLFESVTYAKPYCDGADSPSICDPSEDDPQPLPSPKPANPYPDGTLVRAIGTTPIYLVLSGQRRWIPDPTTFNAMGLVWDAVREISQQDLDTIPQGADLPTINQDSDFDGLVDPLEDALAVRYFPLIWFDPDEKCIAPAVRSVLGNPGTVIARVRRHPHNVERIAITYVILYKKDCGEKIGFITVDDHDGDTEVVAVTLTPNGACPYGYGVYAQKTFAHEGASTEHIEERMPGNTCFSPTIYAAKNKHGTYLTEDSCEKGGVSTPIISGGGTDDCGNGFTLRFNIYNAGEENARRIDDLSNYQFPGEFVWSDNNFISDGADPVHKKLLSERLLPTGW